MAEKCKINYNTLIRKSYDYSQERQDNSPAWAVLRSLYDKNYNHSNCILERIPKKIHQVWLGSKFPDSYKIWADSWKKFNPEWEYKLWTDDNVNEVSMSDVHRRVFNHIQSMGQKSDYLRYHILNQFGGIYIDTDFECLKPFDDLLYLDFFTGVGYPKEVELYIGLIATVPNHPIIQRLVDDIKITENGSHWKKIFNSTGAYYFTRTFLEMVNKDTEGVVAFPMGFFYPFPNNFRKKRQPYLYVKAYSYAIHHWEVSWLVKTN